MFCETRKLAEEFTYRYLAAAHTWATDEPTAITRASATTGGPIPAGPSPAQVRNWARQHGLPVAETAAGSHRRYTDPGATPTPAEHHEGMARWPHVRDRVT
ncbi:MAG: hypothetical protein ACXVGR_16020 [Mycobacteriaceae bacterium]